MIFHRRQCNEPYFGAHLFLLDNNRSFQLMSLFLNKTKVIDSKNFLWHILAALVYKLIFVKMEFCF